MKIMHCLMVSCIMMSASNVIEAKTISSIQLRDPAGNVIQEEISAYETLQDLATALSHRYPIKNLEFFIQGHRQPLKAHIKDLVRQYPGNEFRIRDTVAPTSSIFTSTSTCAPHCPSALTYPELERETGELDVKEEQK
jgi:hypothetical protein